MKNERFGPDSDRHSDRRLSLEMVESDQNKKLFLMFNFP